MSIDTVPDGARLGQTVTITVTVASAENVLRVPVSAVRSAGGRYTVQVVTNGQVQNVQVEVGVRGDSFDEVTSKMAEGSGLSYEMAGRFTIVAIATYCPALIEPLLGSRLQS